MMRRRRSRTALAAAAALVIVALAAGAAYWRRATALPDGATAAHGNKAPVPEPIKTRRAIAVLGFTLIRQVAETNALIAQVGYVCGGVCGSMLGLYLTRKP